MNSPSDTGGGATTEGPVTPVAAPANTAKIFVSIEQQCANYPIVLDALLKVKYKIEHGTLAGSYDIVDQSTDHAQVLLNSPGKSSA